MRCFGLFYNNFNSIWLFHLLFDFTFWFSRRVPNQFPREFVQFSLSKAPQRLTFPVIMKRFLITPEFFLVFFLFFFFLRKKRYCWIKVIIKIKDKEHSFIVVCRWSSHVMLSQVESWVRVMCVCFYCFLKYFIYFSKCPETL